MDKIALAGVQFCANNECENIFLRKTLLYIDLQRPNIGQCCVLDLLIFGDSIGIEYPWLVLKILL